MSFSSFLFLSVSFSFSYLAIIYYRTLVVGRFVFTALNVSFRLCHLHNFKYGLMIHRKLLNDDAFINFSITYNFSIPQPIWIFQPTIPTHSPNRCIPNPLLMLSTTGKLPLPENSSLWSIRTCFTASYPCNTTVGFMPKYRVNTGP